MIPFVDYARAETFKRGGLRVEGMQVHGCHDQWKQVLCSLPLTIIRSSSLNSRMNATRPIRAAVVVVEVMEPARALGESRPKPPTSASRCTSALRHSTPRC